ncbi:hypothetical protein MNBD_GAMMA07-956 [hydrothermal vent metagenome]|uniref:Heavy metal RND efflux outer membrane protein, CzcC family n=1 Tax=hydrothermal vent metagenome TaxID=652676 RepID=A0A3B0WQN8_9ZZZZ
MNALQKIFSFVLLITTFSANAGDPLTLKQAIEQAIADDALILGISEERNAWQELSVSSQAWADPKLRFGAQGVPIDTFDLDQEAMTQVVFGYQQMFPRGNMLNNKAAVMQSNAGHEKSKLELRKRKIALSVKKSWYAVLFRRNAIKIIQSNRKVFEKVLDINESFYASGKTDQQKVVQAELDISLIDDQLQNMQSELMVAEAALAKWLGGKLNVQIDNHPHDDIEFIPPYRELKLDVENHPLIKQANDKLSKHKNMLAMAQDKYSAQWGLDVRYGFRQGENPNGSSRADFLTAMVTVDLPVFTEQKQDRDVAASRSRVQSARYKVIDIERELLTQVKQTHVRLIKFQQRLKMYKVRIKPQSKHNSEVAMLGYQSGVVDFITLSKAQVMEFKTELAELKLEYQFNKTLSNLEFLVGEIE